MELNLFEELYEDDWSLSATVLNTVLDRCIGMECQCSEILLHFRELGLLDHLDEYFWD